MTRASIDLTQSLTDAGPLVSVIIPAYNIADLISDALDSVLKQTYRPFEIIVVDDGSTDNLAKTLLPYRAHIIFLRQANSGIGTARNLGLKAAHGKYIQLLDADDILRPNKLAEQVAYLEKNPEKILVFSDLLCFNNREVNKTYRLYNYSYEGPALRQVLHLKYPAIHTALFRHSLLQGVNYFNPQLHAAEDWDMWLRVAHTGGQFGYWAGDTSLCRITARPQRVSVNLVQVYLAAVKVLESFIPRLTGTEQASYGVAGLHCYLYLRLAVAALTQPNNIELAKDSLQRALGFPHWHLRYILALILAAAVVVLPSVWLQKLTAVTLAVVPKRRLKLLAK